MADILVTSPFQPFTLPTQFKAVFNGYIYCGTVDAVDPSVSQVQVYLVNESGDKVPVAQPLRTNAGGFLVYNGQPAKFVTDSNHSLLVQDSFHVQVWYAPDMSSIDPDSFADELASPGGVALVGGAAREVRTSQYAGFGAALNAALSLDATLIVDDIQNITTTFRKGLAGKNFKIIYEGAGIINYTGPQDESTYRALLTLDGTGVETVVTATRLNGNKTRGVGAPIVGLVVNNVNAHYEGSYAENLSAVSNTVKAKLHVCNKATYRNIHQQLSSQAEFAGVYGYGTVPIECDTVIVFGNEFGAPGAPLDRHAVYASSYDDGTGYCINAFVFDNAVVMRDYRTETPETTFERAFKFIGTKRVHLHNNDLDGGYGFALITHRKHQTTDFVGISENRGRTFSEGITVTSQDSEADEPDSTWQLSDLKLSDNNLSFQTTTPALAVGVRYKNVSRIQDKGSRYYNEAYATANALTVYTASTDRVRATTLDSQGVQYDGFQNIFRGEEPTSLFIDIEVVHAVGSSSPLVPTITAVNRALFVRSIDNSAAWKSGFTSSQIHGFSYYDPTFGRYITSSGAGTWVDDRGFQVVGLSTARPNSVPIGHIFYQTDGSNYIRWTGSAWILITAPWSGIITFGTTAQINAVTKSQLGYGHMIYNTDTKKPAFFDAFAQAWKYADGTAM